MTNPHSSKRIRQALLDLGFRPLGKGNAEGHHQPWANASGREIRPRFSGKEMPHPHLYSLGDSLEVNGICTRQEFIRTVRSR